jgi:hypothetical protein
MHNEKKESLLRAGRAAIACGAAILGGALSSLRADVNVSVGANCQSFTVNNSTLIPWRLGGVRFFDKHSYWTSASDGEVYGWTMVHTTVAGRVQQDLFFESYAQSTAAPVGSKLVPGSSAVFNRGINTETDTAFPDKYVLLHTGGPGVPDDPPDADALALTQLDSVVAVQTTYDSSYRYGFYDSLGVNGGPYSGGFIDTWYDQRNAKAETQVQFPVPGTNFSVNGISVNFLPSGQDYYWMALALCQEYFHADMQWSAAQGAKETGIGTSFLVLPANQSGVYGFWQIDKTSGLDRALCYPRFFPKFSAQLSAARDAASSGINADTLLTYYTRGTRGQTPFNSALMLNSCLISMIFQYENYDICAYSTDICWKNSLAIAADRSMGVSFMAVMYNLGAYMQVGKVAGILNPNSYQQTCSNANAWTLLGTGNFNYVPDILSIVQTEADASRQFEKNHANLTLVDFQISRRELMDIYFGDSGTVDKQGNGGLLLHFYDPAAGTFAAVRQSIWNTLDSAFSMTKGRAPSASPATISFRYDFLPVVRTVKQFFPFIRQQPNGGDAASLIPINSGNYASCGDSSADEVYPSSATTLQAQANGDVSVIDTVRDSGSVKDVRWTLDNSWKTWNKGSVMSTVSATQKVFGFTLTKDQIAFWRDTVRDSLSGHSLWIMASDSSGNSCIGKYQISNSASVTLHPAHFQAPALAVLRSCGTLCIRVFSAGLLGWTMHDPSGRRVAFEQERLRPVGILNINSRSLAQGVYIVQFNSAGKGIQRVKFIR